MKSGYLYVLIHPSDPTLHKIGVTTLTPEKRLAQHNRYLDQYTGRVVKETGQKWKLKTYIEVPDPYWAEQMFWATTPFADIPYLDGIEVMQMSWRSVEAGLAAAQNAGVRPVKSSKLIRNREWMIRQLDGTGIKMLTPYGGLVKKILFQCESEHLFEESPIPVAERKTCPCCVEWKNWWGKGLRKSLST